jgi:hypothetical protein
MPDFTRRGFLRGLGAIAGRAEAPQLPNAGPLLHKDAMRLAMEYLSDDFTGLPNDKVGTLAVLEHTIEGYRSGRFKHHPLAGAIEVDPQDMATALEDAAKLIRSDWKPPQWWFDFTRQRALQFFGSGEIDDLTQAEATLRPFPDPDAALAEYEAEQRTQIEEEKKIEAQDKAERLQADEEFIRAGTSPDRELTASEFEQVVANLVTHRGGDANIKPEEFGARPAGKNALRFSEGMSAAVITPAGRLHDISNARARPVSDAEKDVGGHRALGMCDADDVSDLMEGVQHYTRRKGDVIEITSYASGDEKALSGRARTVTASQISIFHKVAKANGFDIILMREAEDGIELRAATQAEAPQLRKSGYKASGIYLSERASVVHREAERTPSEGQIPPGTPRWPISAAAENEPQLTEYEPEVSISEQSDPDTIGSPDVTERVDEYPDLTARTNKQGGEREFLQPDEHHEGGPILSRRSLLRGGIGAAIAATAAPTDIIEATAKAVEPSPHLLAMESATKAWRLHEPYYLPYSPNDVQGLRTETIHDLGELADELEQDPKAPWHEIRAYRDAVDLLASGWTPPADLVPRTSRRTTENPGAAPEEPRWASVTQQETGPAPLQGKTLAGPPHDAIPPVEVEQPHITARPEIGTGQQSEPASIASASITRRIDEYPDLAGKTKKEEEEKQLLPDESHDGVPISPVAVSCAGSLWRWLQARCQMMSKAQSNTFSLSLKQRHSD